MILEKKYIGSDCHICLSSNAFLARNDDSMRVSLSPTEYKILSFFADRMDRPIDLEKLAIFLWGPNYDVDGKQPESIKSQITRIRKKLDTVSPALASRFETNHGFGSYTFKADPENEIPEDLTNTLAPQTLLQELLTFDQQIETLVTRLEGLQAKIKHAKQKNDSIWQAIYSAQFEVTYNLLIQLKQEILKKRNNTHELSSCIQNYVKSQTYAPDMLMQVESELVCWGFSDHPRSASAYAPDTLMQVEGELAFLRDWLPTAVFKIHDFEHQFSESIADAEQKMQQFLSYLDDLP